MEEHRLHTEQIRAFGRYLREEERSPATAEKYLRAIGQFRSFLAGRPVTKETAAAWKGRLLERGYDPATVNGKLAALNAFLRFAGWEGCRVKSLKLQRRLFRDDARELTREEYGRLTDAARELGRDRLALVMETVCATGIRVSELRYITVEAVRTGKAEVSLKGKLRVILLPRGSAGSC